MLFFLKHFFSKLRTMQITGFTKEPLTLLYTCDVWSQNINIKCYNFQSYYSNLFYIQIENLQITILLLKYLELKCINEKHNKCI